MEFKNVNPDLILRTLRRKGLHESEENKSLKDKWIETIERANDGDVKTLSKITLHFKNLGNFISAMSNLGLLNYFDPFSYNLEDYQNEIFYAFYKNDTSFIWTLIDKYLSDVTKIGDKFYIDTDYGDLSELFDTYRSDISQSTISEILSGDYDMNSWDVTDDEYSDVYEELIPEKKQLVDNRIREELKEWGTTEAGSELMEEIAEEQGRDDVELTDEVINRLFGDEETMQFLINSKLPDIRSDLYSTYNNCYTSTLFDEWYESLWNELEGFAIDSIEGREDYTYQKDTWDKDGNRIKKTYYGVRYPVTKCVHDVAVEFLVANKNNTYSDNTFEYWGSYMGILKALVGDGDRDSLRVPRLDDWPDSRKVSKCVNEYIGDYF
jgi:hypothetical protein